jgi:hypothetical protein
MRLEPHLDNLRTYVAAYALPQPLDVVRLGMCELGLDAVCKGAATIVLESFLKGRFAERAGQRP